MKAINDIIGPSNSFFFGDSPSVVDASLFGMMCQFMFHENGPLHQFIMSKFEILL